MKKAFFGFSIGIAALSVLLIIFLASGLWKQFFYPEEEEQQRTMIITLQEASRLLGDGYAGQMTWEERLDTKVPMESGEIVLAVLNREREEGLAEEQFVAFIDYSVERTVYLTYINFDETDRRYRRLWSAPTAVAHTETLSLFSQDIIGDRNNCIVVTGMNNRNEHTMTIFRRNPSVPEDQAFSKIAELQIDGSIVIQETARPLAYQQGITSGQSYNIAAYSHDNSSSNILDQIETVYSYNQNNDRFEQTRISRVPGSQIEQRQIREILSGEKGVFENFINDLWYYVSPQGTIDSKQYLYFDPAGREIIFFSDEAQQVFLWQNSTPTRYGLYITSQNISITTLRRRIDIEMESLNSIKLRVSEDVRIKIEASESWDGSYRRAGAVTMEETGSSIRPFIEAQYDSSLGRLQFHETGEYSVNSGGTVKTGRYVFYKVNEHELLELRLTGEESGTDNRMIYKIDNAGNASISLSQVRLGTSGIQDLFEPPVTLTLVD